MASIYITEYARRARDAGGYLMNVPEEPPLAEQVLAIGATSVQSTALNAKTTAVRLHSDSTCSVEFGANPVATATKRRLMAGITEAVGIAAGSSPKVAVITNT